MLVDSLVPDMKAAKLTPVSDSDVKMLASKYADVGTQPYGHVGFAVNDYRPVFEDAFDEAITNGVQTEKAKQEYMDRLDESIIRAAVKYNYPLTNLFGVNQEMLELAQLIKKRDSK